MEDISTPLDYDPQAVDPQRHGQREARRRPLPLQLRNSPRYPWALIQLDYCAGVIPIGGIVDKYGVSKIRLETVAREQGWVRRRLTADDIYGSSTFGLRPHDPGAIQPTGDEIRKAAIVQAMQVVQCHRKDVARARALYETLLTRALMALNGTPEVLRDSMGDPILDDDGHEQPLPWTGNRESPGDLLGKLTGALVRIVGIERQAYGLEVLGVRDIDESDGNSVENSLKNDLAALEDKLDSIAKDKAAQAELPAPPVEKPES